MAGAAITTVIAEMIVVTFCFFSSRDERKRIKHKGTISVMIGCVGIIAICYIISLLHLYYIIELILSIILSIIVYSIILCMLKNELMIELLKTFKHRIL